MKIIDKKTNIRQKLHAGKSSPFHTYRQLTVGNVSLARFVRYELYTSLLGPMPGGVGYFLRKVFYRPFFKAMGKGVIIGRNVVIRHPDKLSIGDHVTIDDHCLIDARGAEPADFVIEDNVLINRNCLIVAKNGAVRIGGRTSIGGNSMMVSMDGLDIGTAVLIAGGCYISAGNYDYRKSSDTPVMDQNLCTTGPIRIGDGAWIGTRVTILDGVCIGPNAIIGAGSLVMKDVPEKAVSFGIPAKTVRYRS